MAKVFPTHHDEGMDLQKYHTMVDDYKETLPF